MNFDQKCRFPHMDNSKISLFYKEVVLSWHTLYTKRWIAVGITDIGDIFDFCGFITLQYFYRDLKNITCKYMYSYLIEKKTKEPSSEQSWNLYFQTDVDWSSVWIYQTTNLTGQMYLVEFNFKLLHNILPSGTLLHKRKLSNSVLCILCKTPDDYEHMFIYWYYVKSLWSRVTLLIYKSLNIVFNVNHKHVVLGYNDNDSSNGIRDDRKTRVINIVISIAKYANFKVWCKHNSNENTYLVAKLNLYSTF